MHTRTQDWFSIEKIIEDSTGFRYYSSPDPIQLEPYFNVGANGCNLDHGERTNRKLKVQPFYHRTRTGKMRGW